MTKRYTSPLDFKQALEQRIRSRAVGAEISRHRTLIAFQRLLARIVDDFGHRVVVKGGFALELRLDHARTTKDLDLALFGNEDALLERLQALGQRDLGDFMTFEIRPAGSSEISGDGVRYGGKRFSAECRLANKPFVGGFGLDIVFGGHMLGAPTLIKGRDYLEFAGLPAPELQVIPVETHLAEKLHAYTMPKGSSRIRDLPDMALLATVKESLRAVAVAEAIRKTFDARGTHAAAGSLPAPPAAWQKPYEQLASQQRLKWKTLDAVTGAVQQFLDPVLGGGDCGTWDRAQWTWTP